MWQQTRLSPARGLEMSERREITGTAKLCGMAVPDLHRETWSHPCFMNSLNSSQSLTLSRRKFLPSVLYLEECQIQVLPPTSAHMNCWACDRNGSNQCQVTFLNRCCHTGTSLSQGINRPSCCVVWTKCQYPEFLETCERLELVVQTPLKFLFSECPILGSYFFLVNFAFLLRVDWHDFRLGTWAGKRRTICGVGQLIRSSLIFSKLNVNLNPSPKSVLKPEQNTSTNQEPLP